MRSSIKLSLFLSIILSFGFSIESTAQIDSNKMEANIFPNPNSGVFYITLINNTSCMSQLFGMDGKLVKTIYLNEGLNYVSIQAPDGIYVLKVGEGKLMQDYKVVITN